MKSETKDLAYKAQHTVSKCCSCRACPAVSVLAVLALAAVAVAQTASPGTTVRDPFWPLNYAPPAPVADPKPEPPKPPPAPAPPPVRPVTQSDWAMARKTLSVSGTIRSTMPGSGETREQIMINRNMYGVGDSVVITNLDMRFVWTVGQGADKSLELKQAEALRLPPGSKQ